MNLSANIAKKYEKNKLKRIFIKKNFIFMKIKEQKKILRELNMKLDMQTNEHKESDNQEAEENENSTDFEW